MEKEEVQSHLASTFAGLSEGDLPAKVGLKKGKVRDILDLGDRLLIVTSDRISAFDRVLTTIPCKGEVLNRLSVYWFNETRDILKNHLIEQSTPRSMLVKKGNVVPIEVVVRGYLTGSAWRDYSAGKAVSGIELPAGMKMNQRFEKPLLTPSTKEEQGAHDRPISTKEIAESGVVDPALWSQIERAAADLFRRGSELLETRGLILVDTKYEFAIADDALMLVDEVHTPDSSRFWFKDTYQELFDTGRDQRKIDKEYLRGWLMDRGFMGDGEPPEIPDEVRVEVARRYIQAFELITGAEFEATSADAEAERKGIMSLL